MAESFSLYEALLWEPPHGYFLLEEHLERLARSAAHFGFALEPDGARRRLAAFAEELPRSPRKVRLIASRTGAIALEQVDVKPSTPVRAVLAREPVDSHDEFLKHKTSRRGVYERALAGRPGADEVVLWNERGELTESCSANLVLEIGGRRLTPHADSGLLPGTFRGHLLARGELEEQLLPLESLEQASALYLVNSVRRWCQLRLAQAPDESSRASL